jgi:hypothetical protein
VRQHDQADERAPHPRDRRIGLGLAVGDHADDGLQRGGRQLERQRDQPDLAEVEAVGLLDEGINCRQQRLHHVVEEVREAQRQHDRERRLGRRRGPAPSFGLH